MVVLNNFWRFGFWAALGFCPVFWALLSVRRCPNFVFLYKIILVFLKNFDFNREILITIFEKTVFSLLFDSRWDDSNIQWHHSSSIQMKLCISSTVYFLYSPHSHGNSTCKLCTLFGCTCFKTDSRNKQQYNVIRG